MTLDTTWNSNHDDERFIQLLRTDINEGLRILDCVYSPAGIRILRAKGWCIPAYLEEDLRLELQCKTWQSFEGFDPSRSSFVTFLTGIAQNVLREHQRNARPTLSLEALGRDFPTKRHFHNCPCVIKKRRLLRILIKKLNGNQRLLAEMDLASPSERADTKDVMAATGLRTPGAVYALRARYVKRLHQLRYHRHNARIARRRSSRK